jgi:hypothetical protein
MLIAMNAWILNNVHLFSVSSNACHPLQNCILRYGGSVPIAL